MSAVRKKGDRGCSLHRLHSGEIVDDHNYKPHRRWIRTTRIVPLAPDEVSDSIGSRLLGELATKGGVGSDCHRNSLALGERGPKDRG